MSFCVRLISLALLFSSALALRTPSQFYICGENIIKHTVVRDAVAEGCSRYLGNGGCSGMNCLGPSSLPQQYRGKHFPANHEYKIMWPLKIKTGFLTTKKIGFVVVDISNDNCSLVGSIYKLKNTEYAVCNGPFHKGSLQTQEDPEHVTSFFQTPGGTSIVSR